MAVTKSFTDRGWTDQVKGFKATKLATFSTNSSLRLRKHTFKKGACAENGYLLRSMFDNFHTYLGAVYEEATDCIAAQAELTRVYEDMKQRLSNASYSDRSMMHNEAVPETPLLKAV